MRGIHIPVKRSRLYEQTLQLLGGKDAKLFTTLREALTFCAVLGYKERRRTPLDPRAGTEDIAGAQYQLNEAADMIFALALAEEKSSDILHPDREKACIQVYEEYANGGLELVQAWLERYADSDVEDAVEKGLRSIGISPPQKVKQESEVVGPDF